MFSSFRQDERDEDGSVDTTTDQININDQSPHEKKDGPGESESSWSSPKVQETKKDEEKEADKDEVEPQLSSSVTIDMGDVHSSMELSTIAGMSEPRRVVGLLKK